MAEDTGTLPANALTMGEPAGIGAELTVKAWHFHRAELSPFFVIDDPNRLRSAAVTLGLDTKVQTIDTPDQATATFETAIPVIPLSKTVDATPGNPDPANAPAVMESIERAVALCREGKAAAVVTNPIQKDALYKAGFPFPGHTEYLAELAGSAGPVMMLASPSLRVVPVTVHLSLRDAISILTTEMIVAQGRIALAALENDFAVASPRLAVAGLNPHAGEAGNLGDDEEKIISPAIAALRAEGADVYGPVPPDALFTPRARKNYDAALCMYHDQALIPIKALDFDHAVNVTLGLPIVRTSPDHGTALDIAGRGVAEPASLVAALVLAGEIARNRRIKGGD